MLKTVYDAKGTPYTVEGVDAREYLATGEYYASPPSPPTPEVVVSVVPPAPVPATPTPAAKPSPFAKKATT